MVKISRFILVPWVAVLAFILATTVLFGAEAGAAGISDSEIHDLFSQAKEAFRTANTAAARGEVEAARDLYGRAILRFERIAREGGVRNGKLYYNIANAYFRKGELGRAILNYRRSARLIPADSNLRENLDYARSLRLDKIEVESEKRLLETLFFWHYTWPTKVRFLLFVLFFALVWLLLIIARLAPRSPGLRVGMVLCIILCSAMLVSATVSSARTALVKEGVITAEEVVARKGDGESYQPSFTDPLHEGTEYTVRDQRGGWSRIRLLDGRECWIKDTDGEVI